LLLDFASLCVSDSLLCLAQHQIHMFIVRNQETLTATTVPHFYMDCFLK
jgi:hypothetical protein